MDYKEIKKLNQKDFNELKSLIDKDVIRRNKAATKVYWKEYWEGFEEKSGTALINYIGMYFYYWQSSNSIQIILLQRDSAKKGEVFNPFLHFLEIAKENKPRNLDKLLIED